MTPFSALVEKRGFLALRDSIIPELPAKPGNLPAELFKRVKLADDFVELRLALADDVGGGVFEGFLSGNAVEPALLGELFVAGKIEAHEEMYSAVGRRGSLRSFRSGGEVLLGLGSSFGCCLRGFSRSSGFCGFGGRRRGCGFCFGAFDFVEKLFVQAESLLPTFQSVAGLLSFLLVGAEIKEQVSMGHEMSLRREVRPSQDDDDSGRRVLAKRLL